MYTTAITVYVMGTRDTKINKTHHDPEELTVKCLFLDIFASTTDVLEHHSTVTFLQSTPDCSTFRQPIHFFLRLQLE